MIKNIKYKLLFLVVILCTASTSCNKWLDLKPEDGLIKEDFWKTKEQLQSAVIGCYSSLLNAGLVSNLFLWGEIRADMVAPTANATVDEQNMAFDQIISSNGLTDWGAIYKTINYCNTVIDNAPEVIKSDATLTELQMNAYIAEARALRGLMYFYLLRIWGEVPLQLSATTSDANIKQLPKSSKEEVYQQIKADLDFAATNAVNNYPDNDSNKGRINQYSVFAIQADVALWMEKYDECIAACDKIINSQKYGLIDGTNQSTWFNTLYMLGNSNESIFEFQFNTSALNGWYSAFASPTRRINASALIADFYGEVDPAFPDVIDIRADNGSYRYSDLTIWKQVGTLNVNTTVSASNSARHWFVYRYADILLMKAEALTWLDGGIPANADLALDLVKTIRTRANALSDTEESPSSDSPLDVSDYILRERAREFAFEGKRWFDLLRHAKRNNYAHLDLILDAISKVAPADKAQAILNKFKDVRSHYLPIALSELTADKLLVQNPFYQ